MRRVRRRSRVALSKLVLVAVVGGSVGGWVVLGAPWEASAATLRVAVVTPVRRARVPHGSKTVPRFPSSHGVVSAAHYLAGREGEKAFAVYSNKHKISGVKIHERFHSASVVKSMLLVAYLKKLAVEHRRLDSASEGLMYPMIHSSDNGAASAIFAIVGEGGLARVAREAHMSDYESGEGVWGFTEISAADMARFFYIQDRLIPRRFDGYARWLLSHIEAGESWGIPAAARPRFKVFFKGGWLPEIEGLVNQVARLERGKQTFAMAVLTRGDPSMGYGEETLAGVASRLIQGA